MPTQSWVEGIQGDFPIHMAIVDVMPKNTKVVAGESWGISAWTKTAKISAILEDGSPQEYFVKCATGTATKTLVWGEYHSAVAIEKVVPSFGPEPVGKGQYLENDGTEVYFFLMIFHDMDDNQNPPDPVDLAQQIAALHQNSKSPNGMFGFDVPTGGGILVRTVTWEKSWAAQFTHQIKDVIELDNDANGIWPEHEEACKQLIDHVIPRLLGVLQSEGRSIKPSLVHLDIWEGNVATDQETGDIVIFDPGCVYAHNEIEFGTWRCRWATHFRLPMYIAQYQQLVPASEPAEEWDDRNRLYAIRAALTDSAGHPGSSSRIIANNDILFLCEKYAPLDVLKTLQKYDPSKEVGAAGVAEAYDVMAGATEDKKNPHPLVIF